MHNFSESTLVEQPAIGLFAQLDYETAHTFSETFGRKSMLGRETNAEVVLVPRLRAALKRLNPGLAGEAIQLAVDELTRDRSALSPANANREVYRLLKNGIAVHIRDEGEQEITETVRVIDWNAPTNNDFFLASQFKVAGEVYNRRADLVGFVNGLPLIFIELKATHQRLENAYRDNLRDYRDTIPHIFWYNAFIILSNGHESRIGSMTAGWEHFFEWKKISSEEEKGVISLETLIRGTCEKTRLLDIVENFTLFNDAGGALVKLIARNHQFLGVNNALEAVRSIQENAGQLGVFWHTQGSGKSLSMVFFSQKVLRKIPGNWTFLVVTDRQELDDQIYKTFSNVGAVTEHQVQAESGDHLQQLLREDHRNIFTLIQKFHIDKGQTYPKLSERSDIIVITDEAHRTQYDILALNMRNALPKAAFIGFTGTPLMKTGEEKTRAVFGDYVSIYNFGQSVADGTTVPLFYENRIPELQLTNANFNEDMEQLIENAELNEGQQKRLEREFAREYQLITRDERLEKVAEDIVAHFMERGEMGKAMVISIDKATAVRMYDKVQAYWKRYLEKLREQLPGYTKDEPERQLLQEKIAFMESTDMAVVVSQSQNEIDDFRKKGLDILTHRRRMLKEDLETRFKQADDPLRIVFVCAMWITGFDVPSLSTLYLDKPMRNHTLMQTIARANRVFHDKVNGLIVDYIGVFRDLQKALAIYGSASGGDVKEGEMPVKDKGELVAALKKAIAETADFCQQQGINAQKILDTPAQDFQRAGLIDDAVDALLVNDEIKKQYLALANAVARLYKAILPDTTANTYSAIVALFAVIATRIHRTLPDSDIHGVLDDIEHLMDISVATKSYVIREASSPYDTSSRIDLSQIDFDALKAHFERAHKHTEAEKLRGAVNSKLKRMVQLNKSRTDYLEKFQRLIDEYNTGSLNVEIFFDKLLVLTQELNAEEQRHVAEQLTEEELAVFDLLTRPDMQLSEKEKDEVKKVARGLLETLKREKLVLDWRKKQQERARVLTAVRDILDSGLPRAYTKDLYERKCDEVYQHIYDSYYGQGRSIYATAS
ncbi:MAG TPA: type I restriction endonuclease subunit R [Ktedonobacteraceae bacterium]|nr:type I restriction endonuclease subunit R [Ktedonobacteraceae bacterium]